MQDTFAYDAIGRLSTYTVSGGGSGSPMSRSVELRYNALGMLLYKSDVGYYSYGAQATAGVQPHALKSVAFTGSPATPSTPAIEPYTTLYSYDLNGNLKTANVGRYTTLAYTSFNLPDAQNGINGPSGATANPLPRYTWQYDENHQRVKETRINASGTRITWMLHPDNQGGLGFEQEQEQLNGSAAATASNRHYISAGGTTIAVLVSTGALPTLASNVTAPPVLGTLNAQKLEFWHKDHLGSLIATSDHRGTVTARYAYDPFGKRRHTNSSYDAFGNLVVDWSTSLNHGTDRGYTGHEHLDDVGLIHMNGRVFDPTLGRFLQADPFIQDPLNLQNFDRYGYCYNNPLTCTDPTGYFSLKKLIGVLLFGPIPVLLNNSQTGRMILAIAASVVLGPNGSLALLSGAGAAVGNAAIAGFVSGAVATGNLEGAIQGAFSGAMFGAIGAEIHGVAGTPNAFHPVTQVAMHGVAGCVTSVAGGGKCGSGALSAAFSKALTFNSYVGRVSDAAIDGNMGARIEGTIIAAVAGGTGSVLGGGKFSNGAVTGAFSYLFNELAQQTTKAQRGYGESGVSWRRTRELSMSGFQDVLVVDIDSLDFRGVKNDASWKAGEIRPFNFENSRDYLPFGTVDLVKVDDRTFKVAENVWDNDQKPPNGTWQRDARNAATFMNDVAHYGGSKSFIMRFDGVRRFDDLGRKY